MADESSTPNVYNILVTKSTSDFIDYIDKIFVKLLASNSDKDNMNSLIALLTNNIDCAIKILTNRTNTNINIIIEPINKLKQDLARLSNDKNPRKQLLSIKYMLTKFSVCVLNNLEPPEMKTINFSITIYDRYIIKLSNGLIISIAHNIAMGYNTIGNIVDTIVGEPGEPISLHYDDPYALHIVLTSDKICGPGDIGTYIRIIKAIDFLDNDEVLNIVLVGLEKLFEDDTFIATIRPMKYYVQGLLMGLPATISHRFFELVNILVTEYTCEIDNYSGNLIVSDDLDRFVVIERTGIMLKYNMYNKGICYRRFIISPSHDTNEPVGKWALSNDGNLYAATINMNSSNELDDHDITIDAGNDTIYEYYAKDDYTEHLSVIIGDRASIIQTISQDTKRYAVIYHITNDEVIYEVRERSDSQHFSSDDRVLSTITLPHLQHEHYTSKFVDDVFVDDVVVYRTKLPCASPQMKIIIYQLPDDLKTAKYRILCPYTNKTAIIDFHAEPYIILEDGTSALRGMEKMTIDIIGPNRISTSILYYMLYSHDEKKLAIVFRCIENYDHIVFIYSLTGIILQYYTFNKEVPIALGNNYIITIDSIFHATNFSSLDINIYSVEKPADDTDVHIKIWSTINPEKNILLYKTKIDLSIAPNATWNISKIWTGLHDSLLIEYVYKIPDQPLKKILQKYTIKSYDGIKSFLDDKLS